MLAAGVIAAAHDALDVVKVRDSVYMIAGAGSNVTVQFGFWQDKDPVHERIRIGAGQREA